MPCYAWAPASTVDPHLGLTCPGRAPIAKKLPLSADHDATEAPLATSHTRTLESAEHVAILVPLCKGVCEGGEK